MSRGLQCRRSPTSKSFWKPPLETALYLPVKRFLEKLGFTVKGEIGGCDLVALSGDDPPIVVIGELKLTFNLD